jgi:hypothetical protein
MNGDSMNKGPVRSEDADFDEYLAGQSELSRQYHIAIDEQPAPSIDAAVKFRAAAQAQRLRLKRYARWTVPVALAASVVFAVTALLQAPSTQMGVSRTMEIAKQESKAREAAVPPSEVTVDISQPVVQMPKMDMAVRSSAPSIAMAMPQERAERSDKATSTPVESERSAAPDANAALALDSAPITASGATQPEPVPAAPPAQAFTATDSLAATPPEAPAMSARSAKPQSGAQARLMAKRASSAPAAAMPAVKSPEVWLQEIALLRKQGKVIEAETQLKEFSARYPDYQIPISASSPVEAAPAHESAPK